MHNLMSEQLAHQRQQERDAGPRIASLRIALQARRREAKRLGD